jgi:hypothetical protein
VKVGIKPTELKKTKEVVKTHNYEGRIGTKQ